MVLNAQDYFFRFFQFGFIGCVGAVAQVNQCCAHDFAGVVQQSDTAAELGCQLGIEDILPTIGCFIPIIPVETYARRSPEIGYAMLHARIKRRFGKCRINVLNI